MSRNVCCVPGCPVKKEDGVPLHRFPYFALYPDRYNTWIKIIDENLHELNELYVYNNLRVCRKHFSDIDLYPNKHLNKLAVPELLLPGKSSKETTSSTDNSLPLPDTSVPASDTSLAPSDTNLAQSYTNPPPSDTRLPPFDTHPPPSDTSLPPSDTHPPQSDTSLLPSDTHPPPTDTSLPPSDTHPPPIDTSLPPPDTNPPLSDTSLALSDTCLPPSDTEDAIDNDDPQDFDSSEHNYTKKPTLLDPPQLPKPCEQNKPVKKPIIVVLSNTVISKTVTDESAASLSAPTSPSPELPVESSDRTLGGFKLGVSEQVLQFRLVDDGDCDEPIYKVLAEEQPETRVKTTACNTECNTVLQEEPSTTEDDGVKDKPEPQENVTKYESHNDKEYWKMKLTHILHETKFCGICLNAEDGMNALSDELEIVNCEINYRKTLQQIVDCVFKKIDYPLANSLVCEGCTNKLIQSYMFIRSAEETAIVLNFHLNELYNKTCYIRNNDLKNKQAGSEIFNVVIALDKEIPKGFDCDITSEEPRTAESKLNHPRAKRKLKCVSCNVILPSHRAWRLHETTTHRNNHRCPICLQSFRTRENFTAHYRTHLYARCTICHRTVRDGRLLQHLKRRHRRSVHLCSTCDVAFYSAATLARHNRQCHRGAPRCAACLALVARGPPAHRCRLACPACGAAPCAHGAALRSLRRQALNVAPRAACGRCRYVCSSRQALVAHYDELHLAGRHRCGGCGQQVRCRSDLAGHVCESRHARKGVHVCEFCDRQFSREVVCQRHRKECGRIQRQYQCDYCPANFDSSRNLTHHRKRKHGKQTFSCNMCDRVFLNDAKKRKHWQQVHSRREERTSSSECVMCQIRFPTKAALLLHLRYHEPGTKFPCGVCGARFDTVAQFSTHNCNRTRALSMCEMCGLVVRQVVLREHMRAHAGGAVACATCGKPFQNVTSLQYHQQRHLRNVSCRKCYKSISSAKLWRHLRNHLIRESYQRKLVF